MIRMLAIASIESATWTHDRAERVAELTRRHGRMIEQLDLGVVTVFSSSTQAALAALAIQHEFPEVRIGIAAGDVTCDGDHVSGFPVALAKRVREWAAPGATLVTEAAFHAMNRYEVAGDDIGCISLRGLEEAVRIFWARAPIAVSRTSTDVAILAVSATTREPLYDLGELFETYDTSVFHCVMEQRGLFRFDRDGCLVFTFADPLAAVAAARGLLEHSRFMRELSPAFVGARMGLAWGSVVQHAGHYFGSRALNEAIYACRAAATDQVLIVHDLVEAARARDPASADGFARAPELAVKGREGRIVVWQLVNSQA